MARPAGSKGRALPSYSLIVVGAGGVGKSALTLRYVYGDFTDAYDPTRADSYSKVASVDGLDVRVDILDTAGQEEYAAIRDNYFRSGDAFLLVFSLAERESLSVLPELREQICRALNRDDPVLLVVGNKSDLESQRQVSFAEGEELAARWPSTQYLETSAKAKVNVEEAFECVVRRVMADRAARGIETDVPGRGRRANKRRSQNGTWCSIF